MQAQDEVGVDSKARLWTGRVITVLTVTFLLFDAMVKILKLPVAVEGTVRLGYPAGLVMWIGIVELICLGAYLHPRTAVLGAVLLTGYLGGATATQVRLEDPWFIFPVVVGVLVWAGLFLRNGRLRPLFHYSHISCGLAHCCAFCCLSLWLLSPFGAVTGTPRSCATRIWST